MSAIASGLTILFLFWSITHFARRIVMKTDPAAEPGSRQIFTIMACGVIGALGLCVYGFFLVQCGRRRSLCLVGFLHGAGFLGDPEMAAAGG